MPTASTTLSPATPGRVHIIGAGLAGLAAAIRLRTLGPRLTVYEAAPMAGGRCRSYHDPQLGCVIDNGNHLLMSGNSAAMDFLAEIGASDRVAGPATGAFPFVDVANGARWTVRPSQGLIPWWIFDRSRRIPGTSFLDYLSVLCLFGGGKDATVGARLGASGELFRKFWEPLTVGAINTAPDRAAAALLRPVLLETFLRGGAASRPLVARTSLADAFIEPALTTLGSVGVELRFGARVSAMTIDDGRIAAMACAGATVALAPEDIVILAVPPWIAETLLPGLRVPPPGEPIVNVHYRLPRAVPAPGGVRIVGVIGGLAQWVFARTVENETMISVTISAARAVIDHSAEQIARACWRDVALALELEGVPEPMSRVVKEHRATFDQTPATLGLRPATRTPCPNLLLAGDWTATGLPATIEGAVRSGFKAAALALASIAANAAPKKL